MAQQSTDSADEMITGVNITPLVDVVLVLLVILMVTASYLASHAIPVDLPKGATGEATTSILSVSITRNGNLFLDATSVDDRTFRTLVRRAREKDSEVRAVIAADGGTAHRDVVHVIDLLRLEQVTRFALNVDPEVVAHELR
ncbi:MAG TPA: biopolymer transporter ExbD [Polyangiaceae bacterium]|jgi:biopolymer transport protein ExbD|nr:biopolymer transporter ExbD [Polyangiaceae bacterium]